VELNELSLDEIKGFSPLIESDVFESLSLESALATKSQTGGTSRKSVSEALAAARASLL
jgi:argininosuccinate lyase